MKESLRYKDKTVIFQETFADAATVAANGGAVNGAPTFSNGKTTFVSGTSDYLSYSKGKIDLSGRTAFSTRFKMSRTTSGNDIGFSQGHSTSYRFSFVMLSDGYIYINVCNGSNAPYAYCYLPGTSEYDFVVVYNGAGAANADRLKLYINGVSTVLLFDSTIPTSTGITTGSLRLGNYYSLNYTNSNGSIELFQIYNHTLTAEEVSALYHNNLYTQPNNQNVILHIPPTPSIIDLKGNIITNTSVTVVRDGDKDVMKFNGSSAYLNLDSCVASLNDDTIGTISFWINPIAETNQREIFGFGDTDDQQFIHMTMNATGTIDFGATLNGYGHWNVRTTNPVLTSNSWIHVCGTQDGIQPKIYINGVLVAQSNITSTHLGSWFDNQTVPGIDNGRLGCLNAASIGNFNFINGKISNFKVLSSAMTAEEVARDYNSTKHLYNA